ncbi:DUF7167 family protein [Clostridium botulinum]|uniref:DUF7167 family protein n=1 Tax=Clostridium botulinum TaxID=1491 RepID=UPI001C9A36B3|nr:hypothetical protein [Clostridium botulinum]MBY6842653.1 hypothetical protein [Clostridium botulinum]
MREQEVITKRYKFSVGTKYVGSEVENDKKIEFTKEEYEDENQRKEIIDECYEEWVRENINGCWEEIE